MPLTDNSVIRVVITSQDIPEGHREHILKMLAVVESRQNVLNQALLAETVTLAISSDEELPS